MLEALLKGFLETMLKRSLIGPLLWTFTTPKKEAPERPRGSWCQAKACPKGPSAHVYGPQRSRQFRFEGSEFSRRVKGYWV